MRVLAIVGVALAAIVAVPEPARAKIRFNRGTIVSVRVRSFVRPHRSSINRGPIRLRNLDLASPRGAVLPRATPHMVGVQKSRNLDDLNPCGFPHIGSHPSRMPLRRLTHLPVRSGPIRHSAMGVGIPGLVPSGKACSFGICPLSPKVHGRNSEIIGLVFMKYRGRSSMERFEHKGVVFFVKPDRKEGFYSFRFILNKRRCGEGRRPSCAALAIRRARHPIDRILREHRGW